MPMHWSNFIPNFHISLFVNKILLHEESSVDSETWYYLKAGGHSKWLRHDTAQEISQVDMAGGGGGHTMGFTDYRHS